MTQTNDNNKKSIFHNRTFQIETIYLIVIIIITLVIVFDIIDTGFFLGPLRFSHWMGIIGATFIFIYTPIFYVLKRKYRSRYKLLLNIHVFGFTTAFLFISMHFGGQIGRPLAFYPDLGGGLALYIIVALLVFTGYLHRFHPVKIKSGKYVPPHVNRAVHVSLTSGLYIILFIHILINSLP